MLDGTPKEFAERKALTINPAKTCQPIGAMYAGLGIHGCMPHSHGSQGCCSYHRSHLTRHFKEPVMATTSSFTEGSSVFGGLSNLTSALENIFTIYDPEIVAVHTTCLSEVIGDDIPTMIKKAQQKGVVPEGKKVIHTNTPSFVGSHVTGFSNMCKSLVQYLAEHTGEAKDQINLLPGYVDPADMREYKRLAGMMGVTVNMFPDTSDVLDIPLTGKYDMYPKGGATMADIAGSGDSIATVACGDWGSYEAARELEKRCQVPWEGVDLPVGLSATDRFIDTLRQLAAVGVPESIEDERGRLVDLMSDMQQYFYNQRVAVYGDPDQLIPLVEFLVDLDMIPAYVVTGSLGKRFMERINAIAGEKNADIKVSHQQDMFTLHQWIKEEPVDLLIGNTFGKYIARAENNIPFVRYGFPIMDRVTHRIYPTIGYAGALRLLDQIVNALFDKKDRECEEEWFELIM